MVLNARFWTDYFKKSFIPQMHALIETLEKRLLPTFDGIEQEADIKSQEEWERLGSIVSPDDFDAATLAEKAIDEGVEYYMLMNGLRQGVINLFSVALYHLYEQQAMFFHRRQVLYPTEENNPALFKSKQFQKRLLVDHNIDISKFGSWPRLEEFRLVANTIKHASGDSAKELHKLRPDIFKVKDNLPKLHTFPENVYLPLIGEDIYLALPDIKIYANAVEQFWDELSDKMEMSA